MLALRRVAFQTSGAADRPCMGRRSHLPSGDILGRWLAGRHSFPDTGCVLSEQLQWCVSVRVR